MMRGISLCAGAMLVTSSLSWLGVAQTNLPPSAPVSVVSDPASTSSIGDANRTGNKERSAERVPQDRTIRIGTGDLLQITVFGVPDLAEEVRVNDAGSVSVPLIGNVHLAGLTSDEAQQLIATRLRDRGFLRDPQVAVFQKEYASQGVAVMGEVQR